MMEMLRQQLLASEDGIELAAFFEACPTRSAMICALLAVLELVRLQAIVLTQKEIFRRHLAAKAQNVRRGFPGGVATAIDGREARRRQQTVKKPEEKPTEKAMAKPTEKPSEKMDEQYQ